MSKFKVGDKVRTKDGGYSFDPTEGTVSEIFTDGRAACRVFIPGREKSGVFTKNWFYSESELELIKQEPSTPPSLSSIRHSGRIV